MKYLNVSIPKGKEPKKYNFVERRAEILRIIIEAGHPKTITQTQLAKRYSKSQAMIHKDIKKIAAEAVKELGTDAEFITHIVFESTIRNLMKGNNRDKYNAAKLAKEWYEWLQGMGLKKKTAQDSNITEQTQFSSMEEAIVKFIEKRKDKPKDSGVSEPKKANI